MQAINFSLDEKLLKEIDRLVKRNKTSRSALVSEALREHLKRMREPELHEKKR